MLIGPSVLVLVHVSRGGTRRPLAYGETLELWNGVRLMAEFPTTLILDLLAGLVANVEMTDRVRQTMPAKRKPLSPALQARNSARSELRRKRS